MSDRPTDSEMLEASPPMGDGAKQAPTTRECGSLRIVTGGSTVLTCVLAQGHGGRHRAANGIHWRGEQDAEAWDAYRAGYLDGRAEQDTAWRGYEREVAHAESRATAYVAVRPSPSSSEPTP